MENFDGAVSPRGLYKRAVWSIETHSWPERLEAVSCVRDAVDRGEQSVVYVRDGRINQRLKCGYKSS